MSGRAKPREHFHLTDRELETVALAAEGLKVNAIARRLKLSDGAVQSRLKFARAKCGSARTTALVHSAYTSKQLPAPDAEPPVELSEEQLRVLRHLADGLTVVEMRPLVTWSEWRLRNVYGDLLAALDATDRPAFAIKRAWAMGHLGHDQQTT
ncbi:LuxR C-terminal-related transcriptional regulator [Streptomyces sp. NPDC059999]|uniref:LuxR C-terminal-related transcriptional regulator n=1 Tax=Streptomyces sp. NPDC059999 TaxID=3347030 RepID=UPI0036910B58